MSDSIIDIAALAKLKAMIGGDVEDLEELIDDFIESVPEQIAHMSAEVKAQDWPALRIASHSCKSNGRDMGATVLTALCAELELQCKNGAPVDPAAQVAVIAAAAQDAADALKALDLAHV